MAFLTHLLTATSLLFLAHAIYSAHEHASLAPTTPTPADIVLETVLATIALTYAIVASAPALRHIRWAEWAGRIEREGWVPGYDDDATAASAPKQDEGSGVGNPYRLLEERRGFWDVRAARQKFADFIREGESAG